MNKTELQKLKDELEDLEDATAFNLMHTGAHIPGSHVREDEERLRELKEKISLLEKQSK